MKIFVLSLLRSPDRRERIGRLLAEQNIEFKFFNAIDGSEGEHPLWENYNHKKRKWLISGKRPSRGELGCYASHYLLWSKCVELQQPIVVIEDDARVNSNLKQHLDNIENGVKKYSFLRLERKISKCRTTVVESFLGGCVSYMSDNSGGTCGYALTPKAAEALMLNSRVWCMPVDNYIGSSYIHGVPSFLYSPAVIESSEDFGTTIQLNNETAAPFYIKLSREIYTGYRKLRRFLFNRRQIKKLKSPLANSDL
ncbi:glycosyltransferase family 25 protein [Vibrio mediterranei]|uniref:glycosyltransferase family 25 protein n=1 Tax=Vibrio mediterranei TaxID=689 RepID=UPI001EFE717B|nr:glycosyltransferase family 25 protein [Vibrio mediterranei]MCG9626004.1 glycosyltransferase family 25 protein [Vibrio mediterranei]